MYYPLLARHHLPNSKLLTSVGSHEHNLWWQNTLARILFILSRADAPLTKKKISELPSQNQEFLTHSVELPVHRTWQLSFSFREAKQLVHPIEVSSEVPWICKEAHTRMRPAALSSLPPGSDIVLPLARMLFIRSVDKKENFGTSLSKSRISDPFCRTSGAQNMAIKFFFSGSKAARTSKFRPKFREYARRHTHACGQPP